MKHFSQSAHASLDEKEKLEGRLKRMQHEYRNELAHTEHVFEMLQAELQQLEEQIAIGHAEEDKCLLAERQDAFRQVKQIRDDEQKRELRLGYLQNHVRGQEMDFQRLHRIMGVKFTPEKPDSVQDIVKASLNHEQRNSSLLHYVGVQNRQIEEIDAELRALEEEEAKLVVEQTRSEQACHKAKVVAKQEAGSSAAIERGIVKRDEDLSKLCPLVTQLCDMVGGGGQTAGDGGMLALKGCRPDTLSDFLRLVDVQIRDLYERAEALPTASGNEWLRDFLQPREIQTHPNVVEVRKELDAAAQKQREAKEAKAMQAGTSMAEDTGLGMTQSEGDPSALGMSVS